VTVRDKAGTRDESLGFRPGEHSSVINLEPVQKSFPYSAKMVLLHGQIRNGLTRSNKYRGGLCDGNATQPAVRE
jgi:hypothetical protein